MYSLTNESFISRLPFLPFVWQTTNINELNRHNFSLYVLKNRRNNDKFLFKNENPKIRQNETEALKVKQVLIRLHMLNKQLKTLNSELQNQKMSTSESFVKLTICGKIEKQINNKQCQITNSELKLFQKKLKKQTKLRDRMKVRKRFWKLKYDYLRERKKILMYKIDCWIKLKQNELLKEKEEKILRKDADVILSDVRAKQLDVKKFLTILQQLESLRKVKLTTSKMKGKISFEAHEVFTNIIERLMSQWKTLGREYSLEEQGLKLMIKVNNEKRISNLNSNDRHYDWQLNMFGNKIIHFLNNDLEKMLLSRIMWDKFVCTIGSTVPIGWIIPTQSTNIWKNYLIKK